MTEKETTYQIFNWEVTAIIHTSDIALVILEGHPSLGPCQLRVLFVHKTLLTRI